MHHYRNSPAKIIEHLFHPIEERAMDAVCTQYPVRHFGGSTRERHHHERLVLRNRLVWIRYVGWMIGNPVARPDLGHVNHCRSTLFPPNSSGHAPNVARTEFIGNAEPASLKPVRWHAVVGEAYEIASLFKQDRSSPEASSEDAAYVSQKRI